jgi:hypothetical protein
MSVACLSVLIDLRTSPASVGEFPSSEITYHRLAEGIVSIHGTAAQLKGVILGSNIVLKIGLIHE